MVALSTLAVVYGIIISLISIPVAAEDKEYARYQLENKLIFPMYPTSVEVFPIRIFSSDSHNETVSRGRIRLLGGLSEVYDSRRQKVSISEFRSTMQCVAADPALDEFYGTLSLMLLYPPKREIVELIAAWAESACTGTSGESDWGRCRSFRDKFKAGDYPQKFEMPGLNVWQKFRLFRIMKGAIYIDWPWGMERLNPGNVMLMMRPIQFVLNMIEDIGDSVFAMGGEHPVMPWTFPFPLIAMAGAMGKFGNAFNTLLWPWTQEFGHELEVQHHIDASHQGQYSRQNQRDLTKTLPWTEKQHKAALYASYDNYRWVLFEVAARHPDLIDFSTNDIQTLFCWSPDCELWNWSKEDISKLGNETIMDSKLAGAALLPYTHHVPKHYVPGHYKYVIVPSGMGGMSTSSRLLYLLAHCECVVLLVTSHLQYHISARLVPWVHYVPLAASGADVAAKVRWLQQHDDLAHRIAENGYNFGSSYLRLEDYLCYAANTIDALAQVMNGTTALEPFNPKLVWGGAHPFERAEK